MHKLDVKREQIAASIAMELGLGDLRGLSAADRTAVDQQTDETIQGCSENADVPADCEEANVKLRQLLKDYRGLEREQTAKAKRDA